MKNRTILKTASILALTGGLFVSSASAAHGIGEAVYGVERSTDLLFNEYKSELIHRGLWKPRGGYSTLYSAIFRMEDYADTLKKYHKHNVNYGALLRVASMIDRQVHIAEDTARSCRVSSRIHGLIRNVSVTTHTLTGACNTGMRGVSTEGRYVERDRFNERGHSTVNRRFTADRRFTDRRAERGYTVNRGYTDRRVTQSCDIRGHAPRARFETNRRGPVIHSRSFRFGF